MPKKQKQRRDFLNTLILIVAITEPLATIPQIYQIWSTKNASGVSVATWIGDVIFALIWLVYGLKIKDKPLFISSVMWVIAESIVVIGALIY